MATHLTQCPCGLTYEVIREYKKVDSATTRCTAPRQDHEELQCGMLLSKHPHEPKLISQPESFHLSQIASVLPRVNTILGCFAQMEEVEINISEEKCTILKCKDGFKLSDCLRTIYPDSILIRSSTWAIIERIKEHAMAKQVRTYLVTGTPGVGKTVSIIVWLYLAVNGKLGMSFKLIIADLKEICIQLRLNDQGTWEESVIDRRVINSTHFENVNDVLYLYDAGYGRYPLLLPFFSVVFSSPNLAHFKDFINIGVMKRKIFYTPTWQWDEIAILYKHSEELQKIAPVSDIFKLFQIWGGTLRHICAYYDIGLEELMNAIHSCNPFTCLQAIEKGSFQSCTENEAKEVRSKLMHLDVVNDSTYENAMINFGSSFIRDKLVEISANSIGHHLF